MQEAGGSVDPQQAPIVIIDDDGDSRESNVHCPPTEEPIVNLVEDHDHIGEKRAREPQSEPAADTYADPASTDEGSDCPICFEPWTNVGPHRVSCLACGHLFGKSCIDTWLKSK